jgi:hypothetical protein
MAERPTMFTSSPAALQASSSCLNSRSTEQSKFNADCQELFNDQPQLPCNITMQHFHVHVSKRQHQIQKGRPTALGVSF